MTLLHNFKWNLFSRITVSTQQPGRMFSAAAKDRAKQMKDFHEELQSAKRIVCLTGAGISAESGIPTFRGAGGFWGKYSATELATLGAFVRNPSLVWQFYAYRRDTVLQTQPNLVRDDLIICTFLFCEAETDTI